MLHGTPSWSYEYAELIFELRSKFRCIAPDFIGFGLSNKPVNFDYNLITLSNHIQLLIEKLELKRVRLIATDFGGAIGLNCIIKNSERFEKIYLANTWAWPIGSVDFIFNITKYIASSFIMKIFYLHFNFSAKYILKMAWGKRTPLTQEVHQMFLDVFPNAEKRVATWKFAEHVCNSNEPLWQIWRHLKTIKHIPIHLFWGFQDGFVNYRHYENWKRVCPWITRTKLLDVGHFVYHEASIEVCDVILKDF
jgi:haloalkane dehalogenase